MYIGRTNIKYMTYFTLQPSLHIDVYLNTYLSVKPNDTFCQVFSLSIVSVSLVRKTKFSRC